MTSSLFSFCIRIYSVFTRFSFVYTGVQRGGEDACRQNGSGDDDGDTGVGSNRCVKE
jgi:hypothetical protein